MSSGFTGAAWAFFLAAGRWFGGEAKARAFLFVGAAGSILRWLAMMADPSPPVLLALQTMHALTFAATHLGSVYLLASLAGSAHRAQAQGWLAASVSLGLAVATLVIGQVYADWGERTYGLMAGLAAIGFGGFAIVAKLTKPKQ